MDNIAARIQLRMLQSENVVETKTKDNVFVALNVATQYRVSDTDVTAAYYKLMEPEMQSVLHRGRSAQLRSATHPGRAIREEGPDRP